MVQIMQITTKAQRGPVLKLVLSLAEVSSKYDTTDSDEQVSETFNINDLAEVRFQFTTKMNPNKIFYSLSYKKHGSAGDGTVKMNVKCEKLGYAKQFVCPDNFTGWIEMGEVAKQTSKYDVKNPGYDRGYVNWGMDILEITFTVRKIETITFPKLYDDEEFCDFHLMTSDGAFSVPVHKACIVTHSDMFRTMLRGEWRESINGRLKIPGMNSQTLRHFKDYLYLGTLPEDSTQLRLLLLVAKCYMIENLKVECVMDLAENVQPEDLYALQDFAAANQFTELTRAIFQVTPDHVVQKAHAIEKDEAGPSEAKKKKSGEEEEEVV